MSKKEIIHSVYKLVVYSPAKLISVLAMLSQRRLHP